MGEFTGIGWTDHTFNIAWGCTKISPGCKFCYADTLSTRFNLDIWGADKSRKVLSQHYWNDPIRWNKKAEKEGIKKKVFSSSMCDIFEDHPTITQELLKLWPLILKTPFLEWQLLTKRADRIAECLPKDWGEGYPNVWLGVSVENNDYVSRVDYLRKIPCKVRFISYEPALGPIDKVNLDNINWLIYGAESGDEHRMADLQWARDIKDLCKSKNVPFFYKQGNHRLSGKDDNLDGTYYKEFPFGMVDPHNPICPGKK